MIFLWHHFHVQAKQTSLSPLCIPSGPEMTEVEPVLDFASSGRSGRRNALPDILGSPAGVNPGDLPLKLAEMNLKGTAAHTVVALC